MSEEEEKYQYFCQKKVILDTSACNESEIGIKILDNYGKE